MKDEACVVVDIYQYPVPCGTPDPCQDGVTLWRYQVCEVDTMDQFCAQFSDHPACATHVPSVPLVPVLPPTGGGGLLALAAVLVAAGAALRRIARRDKAPAPPRGSKAEGAGALIALGGSG